MLNCFEGLPAANVLVAGGLILAMFHLEKAARKRREKMIGNAGAPSGLPKHRHLARISSERANIFLHFGCNQSRCGCVYKNRVNFSHKLEQLVPINIGEALT